MFIGRMSGIKEAENYNQKDVDGVIERCNTLDIVNELRSGRAGRGEERPNEMNNKSIINPVRAGTIQIGEKLTEFDVIKCGEDFTGAWSNATLPKIGDNVKVNFNGLGSGVITGFFKEGDYIGCIVMPHAGQRPQWHIDQFKRACREFNGYMVFEREIKF